MDVYLVLFSSLITYISVIFITPKFIDFFKSIGVYGIDVNKKGNKYVSEIGGVPVLIGYLFGMSFYIAVKTFVYKSTAYIDILGALLTITLIVLLGFVEDLTILLKKKGVKKKGFNQIYKLILPFIPSIPLMAINAGTSSINVPFFKSIDLGLLYPLVVIPVAIIGASNATNLLAGMNGLEAGLGVVYLFFMSVYAYINNSNVAFVISTVFIFALIGFLHYNKYPAKMFPGDSLTYAIGTVMAVVAILGNMEKFALELFLLWFVELFLKMRSGFKAESFGVLTDEGYLKNRYDKVYSLTHVVMKYGKFTEREIVLILCGVQFFIGVLVLLINLL